MQARIYINPLANSTGDYQGDIEVSADVLRGFMLESKVDKNKWSHGLLAAGSTRLALANRERPRYGASSDPNSIFAAAGADGARVRVEYPTTDGGSTYRTIWRGLITSRGGEQDPHVGIAHWIVRSIDSVLGDARLNPGLVSAGQTIQQALAAIFTAGKIAAELPAPAMNAGYYYDPNAGGSVIQDEYELLGDEANALDVLQDLLMAIDGVMALDPYGPLAYINRRGLLALSGPNEITSALDILKIEDGSEQVFNQVIAETGITGDQAEYEVRNEGSISRWGLKTLKVNLKWIRNFEQAAKLAENLLERLATPHRAITLRLNPFDVGGSFFVGAYAGLNIPAAAPIDAPRYGRGRYGDGGRYARTAHGRMQGRFNIEQLKYDLDRDTIDLRLRELH